MQKNDMRYIANMHVHKRPLDMMMQYVCNAFTHAFFLGVGNVSKPERS